MTNGRVSNEQRLVPALMPCAEQVHIQPNRSRHTGRQLAEKSIAGVNIRTLAVLPPQQTAFKWLLTRILRRQQRLELTVPLVHEIKPSLLYPAVEVVLGNLVGVVEHAIARGK